MELARIVRASHTLYNVVQSKSSCIGCLCASFCASYYLCCHWKMLQPLDLLNNMMAKRGNQIKGPVHKEGSLQIDFISMEARNQDSILICLHSLLNLPTVC